MAAIGRVITELLSPVKLANLIMGFRMPHVQCHVYPHYHHDDPLGPLDPQAGDVRLSEADWVQRLTAIRSAFLALR